MTNPHDPYSGRRQREDHRLPGGRARAARAAHADGATRCGSPTYTLFPKPDYFFSTSGAAASASTTASPTTTATTARTSTSPGSASPARASRSTASTARSPPGEPAERPGVDAHGPGGEPGRDVGRGDRHPADDAPPARPAGRLPVRRPRDHAGAPARVARARRDRGARRRLRPDQLERRAVRDRHADRRHEGARVGVELGRQRLPDGADRRSDSWPTTATGWSPRSRRCSTTPRTTRGCIEARCGTISRSWTTSCSGPTR